MTDGLVEAWMLGDIAGSLSARNACGDYAGLLRAHAAQACSWPKLTPTYAALVNQYNRLVDGYNELYRHARSLEDETARQSEQNEALGQGLAAANARVATLEQWGNALAAREAQARHDADFHKASRPSDGQDGHRGRI